MGEGWSFGCCRKRQLRRLVRPLIPQLSLFQVTLWILVHNQLRVKP